MATQWCEEVVWVTQQVPGLLEVMEDLPQLADLLGEVLVLLEVDGSPQWAAMPGSKVMP